MLTVRRSGERGYFDYGWLKTHHSFSFSDYHDPDHMGFRVLRVINEDVVQPGQGFQPHDHRDMEILTYIISGQLKHQDSLGNGSMIAVGDVQRMSAGTGIRHSEVNPSEEEPVHLLQIWIQPAEKGLPPSYEDKHFSEADKSGSFALLAAPEEGPHSLKIHQDVRFYAARLKPSETLRFALALERHGWIQVVAGQLLCNGHLLNAGDGAAISQETLLDFEAAQGGDTEVLLFDLP